MEEEEQEEDKEEEEEGVRWTRMRRSRTGRKMIFWYANHKKSRTFDCRF